MQIITLDDPILRKTSVLVGDIDKGILDFTDGMFEFLHRNKGVGLAAVQLGELLRIFVTHAPDDSPRIFINPEILETSLEVYALEEGCLSIPNVNADVIRACRVRVQAWNERGRPFTLDAEGFLARVIQHELDHLNGVLFIDRISAKKKERLLKQYHRIHVQA